MHWALWLALLAVFLLITTNYVAPWLVRRLSSNVRIRNIGLRSVRGLFLKIGRVTYTADRIALTVHRSPGGARVGLDFQNVVVTIGPDSGNATRPKPRDGWKVLRQQYSAGFSVASIADMLSSTKPLKPKLSFPKWLMQKMVAGCRNVARVVAVSFLVVLMRWLPALTQSFDIQFDQIVAVMEDLGGAHAVVKGLTFAALIKFSKLEENENDDGEEGQADAKSVPLKKSAFKLQGPKRWGDSMRRVWDNATARTTGFASLTIDVEDVVAYPTPVSADRITDYNSRPKLSGFSFDSTGPTGFTTIDRAPPPGSCLSVEGPVHLQMSAGFTPKRMVFRKKTGEAMVHLPAVQVAPDVLIALLERLKKPKDQAESSPIDRSVVGSPSWGPVTFSPPGSPVIGPKVTSSRWNRVRRVKTTPLPQIFFAVLKGIEVNVPVITGRFGGRKGIDPPGSSYSVTNKGFLVRLQLSEPSTSVLHQKWLGSSVPTGSKYDMNVYSFIFQTRSFHARRITAIPQDSLTLLRIGEINVDSVVTGWPAPWVAPARMFVNDPNAAFVAVEAVVDHIEVVERLDALKWLAHRIPSSKPREKPSTGPIVHPVPKVHFRLAVNDPSLRLIEESATRTTFMTVRSEGLHFHVESGFHDEGGAAATPVDQLSPSLPIVMDFVSTARMEPIMLHLTDAGPSTTPDTEEVDFTLSSPSSVTESPIQTYSSLSSTSTPLLVFGGVDFAAKGSAFGFVADQPASGASIDTTTILVEIKTVVDSVVLDLTRTEWHGFLTRVVGLRGTKPSDLSPPGPSKALFDLLPPGYTLHLSLPSIRIGVAGQGLNQDGEITTSRGLAVRTSVVADWSYILAPNHTARIKKKAAKATVRDRLGLKQEHVMAASAHASEARKGDGRAACFQASIGGTTVRSVVGDNNYGWLESNLRDPAFTAGGQVDAHIFLRVPDVHADILLRRRRLDSSNALPFEDSCRVDVRLPIASCRVDLHHVYCALTAVKTIKQLLPSGQAPKKQAPSGLVVTVDVHTDVVQSIIVFPAGSKAFIRCTGLAYSQSLQQNHSISLLNACAWVPHRHSLNAGKWDEFCRLTSWMITISTPPELAIRAAGKGGRFRIPYSFILNELLTDISLIIKGSKHLVKMVSAGQFELIEKPPVEEAKQVPPISINLDALTFEIGDDPFEAKLNMVWKQGFQEQGGRLQREEAFEAKVAAIRAAAVGEGPMETLTSSGKRDHISAEHSVSIEDARSRLDLYNSQSWVRRHKQSRDALAAREETISSRIRDPASSRRLHSALPIDLRHQDKCPPLLRAVMSNVHLSITGPKFPSGTLADYLEDLGGLPRDREFTLLVPLHLTWTATGFRGTLRDYPLPLLEVAEDPSAWSLVTNLVIAEEDGPNSSVDWIQCDVPLPDEDPSIPVFSFLIPKTIMPVKTYAQPEICIKSPHVTDFSWGVSYTPALQDVMRVLDTLSSAPRDPSPPLGFWDKLRLILHWRVRVEFAGELRVHVKGSRDPYYIVGAGAGFVLGFSGHTTLTVGYSASDRELIQVNSDQAYIAVPDLSHFLDPSTTSRKLLKTCAKLTNGVKLGFGFALERTCGSECATCHHVAPFFKQCRFFDFLPHHAVALRVPTYDEGDDTDSYRGFRSNFVHFSISLQSPTHSDETPGAKGSRLGYNIIHLTPKVFELFYAWLSLFTSTLNLPIRQGSYYPDAKPPTPKFGRHLATIKYRISLSPLFITHAYKQDAVEQWREGATGFVGAKAMVENFTVDIHQREQETVIIDKFSKLPKTSTHKPICAAEVVVTNLELRALYALFADPRKALVPQFQSQTFTPTPQTASFPEHKCESKGSKWIDMDDFNETDWTPQDPSPLIWMFRAATCPRFTYFRTIPSQRDVSSDRVGGGIERSKFGDEDTHRCLLSKQDSLTHVQIDLTQRRLAELQKALDEALRDSVDYESAKSYDSANNSSDHSQNGESEAKIQRLKQSIERLESYYKELQSIPDSPAPAFSGGFCHEPHAGSHTSQTTSNDWQGFSNVYEVHSPQIILSNSTRNVLLDYYYSFSNRRAFEFHMSSRALKLLTKLPDEVRRTTEGVRPVQNLQNAAARAATALRKILTSDANEDDTTSARQSREDIEASAGILERKGHFCILFKPQIALHCEEGTEAVVYVAAMEASIKSFGLLDVANIDDPVNGQIMRRQKLELHGVQAFVPTSLRPDSELCGVPLEILVDFRCESQDYERLVPQTDAVIQYDRFNRLRLHSQTGNVSGDLTDGGSANDHMKYQTDRITVKIPRFTVTANSSSFRALNRIITHLLLYTDPYHTRRNEALETFLFTYDFADGQSSVEVVLTLQRRIRQLMDITRRYDMAFDTLDEKDQTDYLMVQAELTSLSDKLDFIFQAIRTAQEKARHFDESLASALQLDVSSDFISWNMLGPASNLLAKLAVKGVRFTWTNRKDSSTSNLLTIADLQALNGLPGAAFPEVLVAHPQPSNHPMVKRKLFAEAKWTVLPPVAQISVVEKFELHLHPIKVQIERKIGRELQEYLTPKNKGQKSPDPAPTSPMNGKGFPSHSQSGHEEPRPSRRSLDHSASLAPPRLAISRSSSMANLRESEHAPTPTPKGGGKLLTIHRSISTASLRPGPSPTPTPHTPTPDGLRRGHVDETAEMRSRARKRTFLSVDIGSFLLVLTYKGEPLNLTRRGDQGAIRARDFVPNLEGFPLTFPRFEHHHSTWNVDEFLKVVKSELKKNAVGVVFRAFNARLSAKYRQGDSQKEISGMTDDLGSTSTLVQANHTPRPPATRLRTISFPLEHPQVLSNEALQESPMSTPQSGSLESSMTSLPSRDTDSKSSRHKVLDLFRPHRKRQSMDTSRRSSGSGGTPRASTDLMSVGETRSPLPRSSSTHG